MTSFFFEAALKSRLGLCVALLCGSAFAADPPPGPHSFDSACKALAVSGGALFLVDGTGVELRRTTGFSLIESLARLSPGGDVLVFVNSPASDQVIFSTFNGALARTSIPADSEPGGMVVGLEWHDDGALKVERAAGRQQSRFDWYTVAQNSGKFSLSRIAGPSYGSTCELGPPTKVPRATACIDHYSVDIAGKIYDHSKLGGVSTVGAKSVVERTTVSIGSDPAFSVTHAGRSGEAVRTAVLLPGGNTVERFLKSGETFPIVLEDDLFVLERTSGQGGSTLDVILYKGLSGSGFLLPQAVWLDDSSLVVATATSGSVSLIRLQPGANDVYHVAGRTVLASAQELTRLETTKRGSIVFSTDTGFFEARYAAPPDGSLVLGARIQRPTTLAVLRTGSAQRISMPVLDWRCPN